MVVVVVVVAVRCHRLPCFYSYMIGIWLLLVALMLLFAEIAIVHKIDKYLDGDVVYSIERLLAIVDHLPRAAFFGNRKLCVLPHRKNDKLALVFVVDLSFVRALVVVRIVDAYTYKTHHPDKTQLNNLYCENEIK